MRGIKKVASSGCNDLRGIEKVASSDYNDLRGIDASAIFEHMARNAASFASEEALIFTNEQLHPCIS